MKLKIDKTLINSCKNKHRVRFLCWSPNNQKFAVCDSDSIISLYDEKNVRRERFSTKPANSKISQTHHVTSMAFSPGSEKLAIAQSDHVVFIYELGESWGTKKFIANKFLQQSMPCLVVWSITGTIVCGLANGKIRLLDCLSNKSSTAYNTGTFVVALALNTSRNGFVSGHIDGKIFLNYLENDSNKDKTKCFVHHSTAPYALEWVGNYVLAGGIDRRITIYDQNGSVSKQFDYTRIDPPHIFDMAIQNSTGQYVLFISASRIRLITINPRDTKIFSDNLIQDNSEAISTMSWKPDGSVITFGSVVGNVGEITCCMKRKFIGQAYEIKHVGLSQLIITWLKTDEYMSVESSFGFEISRVDFLCENKFSVIHTNRSLILVDMKNKHSTEIEWDFQHQKEKFYFGFKGICLVFTTNEITIVKFGDEKQLLKLHTEFPDLNTLSISPRCIESSISSENIKIAYLIDLNTIIVLNYKSRSVVAQINSDEEIECFELSESGKKLLYRNKWMSLYLYDINKCTNLNLLNFCNYAQWIPMSDVVLAQSGTELFVWYTMDSVGTFTKIDIDGEVLSVTRAGGRTEVKTGTGLFTSTHILSECLIEFGMAIDEGDLQKALIHLENDSSLENRRMWSELATISCKNRNTLVTERCYAALGCVSSVRYFRQFRKSTNSSNEDGIGVIYALHNRVFQEIPETISSQDVPFNIVDALLAINKWDDALKFANASSASTGKKLREDYYHWLTKIGREDRAAELKLGEGDLHTAINLFLRAGTPGRIADLLLNDFNLISDKILFQKTIDALSTYGMFEKSGELFEKAGNLESALRLYRQGKAFQRSIELARNAFPSEVVTLEEEWGDFLIEDEQQHDAAIQHFIEAGAYAKAINAALASGQTERVEELLAIASSAANVSRSELGQLQIRLADLYAARGELGRAEKAYLAAGCASKAADAYCKAGMWQDARRLSAVGQGHLMGDGVSNSTCLSQAEQLEGQGKLQAAEALYLSVNAVDRAVGMYKKRRQFREVIRLVRLHQPQLVDQTLCQLGAQLEHEGNLKQAEQFYVEAKDWRLAVNMYRSRAKWEDAFRVASLGSPELRLQVAYLWARELSNTPSAVTALLSRLGLELVEPLVELAAENLDFALAFGLANELDRSDLLVDLYAKRAMHYEDEGKFGEAEMDFIQAGKAREAVLMYVHVQDWDAAARVASEHDQESTSDVLLGQARLAFAEDDLPRAEALLLRAQRPDLAVRAYREAGLMHEAVRVAETYLPHRSNELLLDRMDDRSLKLPPSDRRRPTTSRSTIDRRASGGDNRSDSPPDLDQGHQLEVEGDYLRAIEFYLKLQPDDDGSSDVKACQQGWLRAADLAVKFLDHDSAVKVTELVANRLVKLGDESVKQFLLFSNPTNLHTKQFLVAGELLLSIDKVDKAIEAFVAGKDWSTALRLAADLEPRLEAYVNEKYKEELKLSGQTEQLASIDASAAIELLADQNRWDECLTALETQLAGGLSNEQQLHKYVATYAASLIKQDQVVQAIELYLRYGTPAYTQNFNIYKRIFQDVTSQRDLCSAEGYAIWSELRNMLFNLKQNADRASNLSTGTKDLFTRMLLVTHYHATRSAMLTFDEPPYRLIAKLSISLLRHSDIIPPDKIFYEAGTFCRQVGWDNMAFVFLNRYLDLLDVIEDPEGSPTTLDGADFQNTDIPMEVPLPEHPYTSTEEHESIRSWILTMSMDRRVDQVLPLDARGVFEGTLRCTSTSSIYLPPCILTGYPVCQDDRLEFDGSDMIANRNDWLKMQTMKSTLQWNNTIEFITRWCGTVATSNLGVWPKRD